MTENISDFLRLNRYWLLRPWIIYVNNQRLDSSVVKSNTVSTLYNVCSVHRGDIMSTLGMFITLGGYHEYIGDTMSTSGDTMSTSGDIMMHVGEQVYKSLSISIENPDCTNDILRCTHDIRPDVLMKSPDVLNIPRCTHDIPPMYS